MWEKVFTYFCNKFVPVNPMHYIKCAVNSSLLTLFWLLQKVCGTLDPCFITTQYSHRGCFTNLLWCDIPQNNAPQTGPHHIWCIYTPCRFCGRDKHSDSSAFGLILLASVCYGDSLFSWPTLGLTTNLVVGWSCVFSASSSNFLIRRNLKSLSVYLAPHADNSIQLLSAVRSRRWKFNFMVHIWLVRQKNEYLCSFLEAVPRLVISQ